MTDEPKTLPMPDRHAAEIAQIVADHGVMLARVGGSVDVKTRAIVVTQANARKVIQIRRECSKAIAAACERHRLEANTVAAEPPAEPPPPVVEHEGEANAA